MRCRRTHLEVGAASGQELEILLEVCGRQATSSNRRTATYKLPVVSLLEALVSLLAAGVPTNTHRAS